MIMEQQKIKLELTKGEFDMIINKLKWMRCVVRDGGILNYEDYCNGDCNSKCNRPDLCDFEVWLKSKVVDR